MYDISIVGAGVVGAAIARELSKYNLDICLLDKANDVSTGASKANSGIVHGGYVGKAGTLKGELCIKGNRLIRELDQELNFGFREPGALVVGFDEADEKNIKKIYDNALKVGHDSDDIEIIYDQKRIKEIEPDLNDDVELAFHCKSVGVTSPYEMTIALAENAIENGVELKLGNEVVAITDKEDHFLIETIQDKIKSKYVVNAAGVYSDKIASMVGLDEFEIFPRRGQYVLFAKDQSDLVNSVIFQTPTEKSKGVLVTPTYHGNFMIGPNAEDIDKKENIDTTLEEIEDIIETARKSIPDFDIRRALTTFSGIRAKSSTGDFIVEESAVEGFIHAAGIDSPGLTSSPAIAERVRDILEETGLKLEEDSDFNPHREPIIRKDEQHLEAEIDHERPEKNIICRCERVTEAEILDAMNRGIELKNTDAIKRRTRAGMGNCQANFCQSRVKKLLAEQMDITVDEVTVRGKYEADPPQRVPINKIRKLAKKD
ncbi:MAG: NAD(P)/FAD-dependent oxidoreductase [Bacillota bacterium]